MRAFCRGHVKIALSLLCFAAFLCLFFQDERDDVKFTSFESVPKPTALPNKQVTKSLSELRRLTELNGHVLMLNSVPDAGSEMFVLILQWLQGKNNFRHVRLRSGKGGTLGPNEQREITEEVSAVIQDLAVPLSFDCSTYFINFSRFDWNSPTYFNIIRNPGDSLAAKFSSKFKNKQSYNTNETESRMEQFVSEISGVDLTIPYFCGHDPECSQINSSWALSRAKENVEKFYPVVGVLELLEETLQVLENKLKYYFKGSQEIYKQRFKERHSKWKQRNLLKTNAAKSYLKNILMTEYEFYDWIKDRLLSEAEIYKIETQTDKIARHKKYNFQIEQP